MQDFEDHWNRRVLIVDDQKEIHEDFREMLEARGAPRASDDLAADFLAPRTRPALPAFELLHAECGESACEVIEKGRKSGQPVAVAYIDIRMPPGIDGVETVRRIRAVDRETEVVVMTAYTDKSLSEIIGDMDLLHKLLYIRKPFAREEIQQITLSLVMKWNVEQALAAGRQSLADSNRRLEAVLNSTGDAIAMYDGAARLVFANRWYEQLFDIPGDELRELPRDAAMTHFAEPFRDPRLPAAGRRHPDAGGCDGSVVEPAGTRAGRKQSKPLLYRSTQPVRDGGGDVIGDLVVYRDVSREIEVERMKVEVQRLRSELESTYAFNGIIGSSAGIRKVGALVKRVVDSDVSVLVRGESGTGKELIARALHFNGPRRKAPFLAVNLAAMPETLIESELFGHERGAFTGATAQRSGCFEQARGGTILLDEIGDMPYALQAKLLRVLQERVMRRVGGTATMPVDVRVISATNRDLEAAMREGAFREDLFYRIAVFPIVMPPLRERQEDILPLATHFLKKHAPRIGRPVHGISAGAGLLLARHAWPGNVRELENVICSALVLETTDMLQAANLPPELLPADTGTPPAAAATVAPLADVERRAIAHALEMSGRNLTQAAQALGINRTTLHRKLKKYGQLARD